MKPWKYYVIYGLAACAAALVFWPLIGWIMAQAGGAEFEYTAGEYILRPLIFGIALALLNYHFDSRKSN